jgi:hypothetical protein
MSTENRQNVELILKRLLYVLKLDTDQQLADWLGVGNKVLSAWKSRNSRKAIAVISSKCREFDLNWVLTGEGEPTPNKFKQYAEAIEKTSVKVDQFEYNGQKEGPESNGAEVINILGHITRMGDKADRERTIKELSEFAAKKLSELASQK